MSPVVDVLMALFILIYGALAVIAIRRPLLARLAAREALRRPGQSALLIGGLMIAGASIMAGLVLADSAEASITANALREWGRVDLTVTAGGQSFSRDVATRLAADPNVKRDAAGVQGGVELVSSIADLDRRLARSAVRIIGFDPITQYPFGAYLLMDGTRTYGQDLAPGSVFLSRDMADTLEARVGDRLQIGGRRRGAMQPLDLSVAGITAPEGPGVYGLVPAVFATLETAQRLIGTDQINVVRISAMGDGAAEAAAAHRLAASLPGSLANLPTGNPAVVQEVKANDLAVARTTGEGDRSFFLSLSFLVILAAASLAVNLAVALAEERRPRLAVLRALGLTRSGLVTASVLEGALYSLAAAVLSTVPGVLAVVLILRQFGGPDSAVGLTSKWVVAVSVKPLTLVVAIIAATLITLTTLSIAALRTSRMTVAAAIRDLPDHRPVAGWSLSSRIALGAITLVAVAAVVLGNQGVRLLGGAALIIVVLTLARNLLPERTRATLMGAGLAAWTFFLSAVGTRNAFNPVLPVLVAVIGLSLLAVANLNVLETAVMRFGLGSGTLRATLRPPLAYLSRRPVRTGLATGAFAIVLTGIVMLGVFISAQSSYARDAVRMDVRVAAPGSQSVILPASVQSAVSARVSIPTRVYTGPIVSSQNTTQNSFIRLYQFSGDQLADPPVALFGRDDRFKTDAAVWKAVRDDPTWVVSGITSSGQTITLMGDQGPVRLRIAGQPLPGSLDGLIGSPALLASFEGLPPESTLLLKVQPGVDPSAVARAIQRSAFPEPIDATPTREILERFLAQARGWINLLDLLIGMALVTGVLTIGILALRAVVERRHAIGVLRSIGYLRRNLVTGLVAEAVITTSIGVIVGLAAGAFFGVIFLQVGYPDAPYQMDWGTIGATLALIYGTLILVTVAPAIRTARMPPAQALRLQE